MYNWEELMKLFMTLPEAECMKQLEPRKTTCIGSYCPATKVRVKPNSSELALIQGIC